jgi:hypothetical protein
MDGAPVTAAFTLPVFSFTPVFAAIPAAGFRLGVDATVLVAAVGFQRSRNWPASISVLPGTLAPGFSDG